jgi:hypothetical protein
MRIETCGRDRLPLDAQPVLSVLCVLWCGPGHDTVAKNCEVVHRR